MVNNRMGRVADFKSGVANSHRVFGILTEARGAWSEPRVKKPDLLENFALERHIGPCQAPNLVEFSQKKCIFSSSYTLKKYSHYFEWSLVLFLFKTLIFYRQNF